MPTAPSRLVHGHTPGRDTLGRRQPCSREYGVWQQMLNRCRRENDPEFKRYGARGIRVCERWQSFENFLADMGPCGGLTLDRIDNDRDYEPTNCRWATPRDQANNRRNNRRVTCRGETLTIAEWSRRVGLKYAIIYDRLITCGWPPERALFTTQTRF